MALKNNNKYVKAMERRARVLRKQAARASKNNPSPAEEDELIKKLMTALEDVTAVCILEGFQKQEHMLLVDSILKELGKAEAKAMAARRTSVMASEIFIRQYYQSFSEDPLDGITELNGDAGDTNTDAT